MTVGIVVVAAGAGTRLGASEPKAFVPVAGQPLIWYAVRSALRATDSTATGSTSPGSTNTGSSGTGSVGTGVISVAAVVVVVPASHTDEAAELVEPLSREFAVPVQVVPGGVERGDSVLIGLRWLPEDCAVVLVHDAARAFAPPALFARVAAAVDVATPAVVPGLPVVDTVKIVDATGRVTATPDRSSLRIVQTPQGFRRDVLERAHAQAGSSATDDATLVERLGAPVRVVAGELTAYKITTPEDLDFAARLAAQSG